MCLYKWELRYDAYGNVVYCGEEGDGAEKVYAEIDYLHNEMKQIHNRPGSISVYGADGRLLRKREGYYDDNGSLRALRQYTDGGKWLEWKYEYDVRYGALMAVQDAAGARIEYEYDKELFQYIEEVRRRGSGGSSYYASQIQWDTDRGLKMSETDANGNSLRYEYDVYGRLIAVRSPYDGETAAVSYEYYREAGKRWYAVTKNKISFEKGDDKAITTVAEADGLGRIRRTAKSGEVWRDKLPARVGWNVSGAAEYDGKGRAVKTGQTYFTEATAVSGLLNSLISMVNATEKTYDALDRVTKIKLPDGSESFMSYDVILLDGFPHSMTETKDPLGNLSYEYRDARGLTRRVERKDGKGALLTSAGYEYNGIGEMLSAFDAGGNPLMVSYDLLGRRLSMESADTGKSVYVYNALGQIEEETNSELYERGQAIRYEYDGFGRQVKVVYPTLKAAEYKYGAPGIGNNLAGRLISLTDSSGTVEYEYGLLGEIKKEKRTLARKTGTARPKTAEFEYRSNYLGQMEYIVYPDGEKISYGYDTGGNVTSVEGNNRNVNFKYVNEIGYDEWGQRAYLKMGNGTETRYTYDEQRRWLSHIETENGNTVLQNITYTFDAVGNVSKYVNDAGTYKTEQSYVYDSLYQLTSVEGDSENRQYGMEEYSAYYSQQYSFDENGLGNMTMKASSAANSLSKQLGDMLNYQLSYEYEPGFAHRASRIGDQYYRYDKNGSVVEVRDGPFEAQAAHGNPQVHDLGDNTYYSEGGWGLNEPRPGAQAGTGTGSKQVKEYRWDDRNRMQYSRNEQYSVNYTYGEDGQRTGKWARSNSGGESETLYFGKLWSWHYDGMAGDYTGVNSKNIFLGETRIATKAVYADGSFIKEAEEERQYYYHSDHLGSAQLITDWQGKEYERFEYTPYGELWIEKAAAASDLDVAYRFTGKERDKETGLYYYGARYLDPKDSRWLSVDPAMGEYVPQAPVNDEARKHNENLPGMGGVFNTVNLHVYHYAGNNPVKYIDPDGESLRNFITKLSDSAISVVQTVRSTAASAGQAVWNALNSGEHKAETPTNKPVNDAKAFYASATVDTRLTSGQLNINVEAGGANYSSKEKIIAESSDKKNSLGLEVSVTALAGNAFIGLKDSSIGGEAGFSIVSFSGSLNFNFVDLTIKFRGSFEIGTLEAGASIGLRNTIKLGEGLGGSVQVQFVPRSNGDTP